MSNATTNPIGQTPECIMKKSEIIRQLEDTIHSAEQRIKDMIHDGEANLNLDKEIEDLRQAQHTWLQEAQGMSWRFASATLESINVHRSWTLWAETRPAPYPQSVLSIYNA